MSAPVDDAAEGEPMVGVGGILSTLNVVDAAEAVAVLPSASVAVPATMVIPNVPSPVIELIVTVAPAAVTADTPTVPSAVPVLLSVTFAGTSVEAVAPV